MKYFLYARKST
ncbi:hypothetical protein COT99_00390, partial [Candidatus Falkowbacteria bacterium CG10_big_fil_rev_8_21_14_0_10_43_10]